MNEDFDEFVCFLDLPKLGEISGIVYGDVNKISNRDPGERGLTGITVELDRDGDGICDKLVNRINSGCFSVTDLGKNKVYRIRPVECNEFQQTGPDSETDDRWLLVRVDGPTQTLGLFHKPDLRIKSFDQDPAAFGEPA